VIYNGVDESFREVFRVKDFSRARATLYIGRLHVRKGILNLVRAFAKRPSLDIRFYVIGDGPDCGEIKSLAEKDQRIIVMKDLDAAAIRQIMAQTKYFLFPSLHEGCPNALLEAMASGHVCIAYDIPAVREILGGSGILVRPGDAHGILDQLERLLDCEDRAKSWIEEAYKRAQGFQWTSCAKKLESAFRKMYSTLSM
jgi:glycosyltransferase involved in cell wall biosynthesis